MIQYTSKPDPEEPSQVVLPLDDLDEILDEHLEGLIGRLTSDYPDAVPLWDFVRDQIEAAESSESPWGERTWDHRFFFPLVDDLFAFRERDVRLLKLQYRSDDPVLPMVDELDLRPVIWEREAMVITTEMRIASNKYAIAKSGFKQAKEGATAGKPAGDIDVLSDELRRATRLWYDAKKRLDILSEHAAREGYELTLQPSTISEEVRIDKFYTLTQKVAVTRRVTVRRTGLRSRYVQYKVRRCRTKRRLFWKRRHCWYEYRQRRVFHWATWYESQTVRRLIDTPVAITDDPIGEYLSREMPVSAFGGDATSAESRAKAFSRAIGRSADSVKVEGDKITGLKNSDKEVHVFDMVDGEYRDQDGVSLDAIMDGLDAPGPRGGDVLSRRFFVLLFLPVISPRVSGRPEIVKYLAIHNPIRGRGNNIAPRVFLNETYRVALGQVPGHWLGSFSHSVSLFPGEARSFKLVTEQRLETEQSNEGLSSQKTSTESRVNVRTQVRNELERENRSSRSSHWNASASGGGSWGVFSAKASAGGGGNSSKSSRELARNLSDRIADVLNSASSSNEVQLKTSESVKESRSTVSEQTIEFSNVNHGRAVNFKFFQVMHKYDEAVSLHDVRVVVEYADEIIPGLDITRAAVFRLDELDGILPELIEEERDAIRGAIITFVRERHKEREITFDDGSKEQVAFLREEGGQPVGLIARNVLERRNWFVNSGAFFVESEVSTQPATEKYVEDARSAEIAMQKASVARVQAEAAALGDGQLVLPGTANNLTLNVRHGEDAAEVSPKAEGEE